MGAQSPVDAPLRHHQRAALAALDAAWAAGRRRAWVELPPGAGKTRIGLETAAAMLADGTVRRVLALAPNTAIQAQWEHLARAWGLSTGTDRVLDEEFSALTYQALATFDASAGAVDDVRRGELARLHDNGRALVEEMRGAGSILLILDECHHLLEVWGRLLGEVLDLLPEARVLGLTATPPTTLTATQGQLVDDLFGGIVFATSIPAVVREGDLAPFLDLAWLVRPTAREADWLDESAQRFTELTTALLDPKHGTTAFLPWLDKRVLDPVSWRRILRNEPEQADAVLRLHHAGLVALPPGARLYEQHRQPPSADDWALLWEDWLLACVQSSRKKHDQELIEQVRAALPAIGFVWTKRGLRRGRSPVDRVLARSAAKTVAAVGIADAEQGNLGDRLRLLVLCDYEKASATLPADLRGVIEQQTGSAYDVTAALLADAGTMALPTLLVTAQTVAGAPETLAALREHVAARDPALAQGLEVGVPDEAGVATLTGRWSSRVWVRHATAFFEAGGARVLVGTRALLGEGWDARTVTGLVDLTTVTSSTAVVQTRGRALRTDPGDPEKVAVNWSVVCVAPEHPRGGRDWERLVAKHRGYFGLDETGMVVDGVAHLDPRFSPFAPPSSLDFDAINAAMTIRGQDRIGIRERWRVGSPYDDRVVHTLRVLTDDPAAADDGALPQVYVSGDSLVDRTGELLRVGVPPDWNNRWSLALGSPWLAFVAGGLFATWPVAVGATAAAFVVGISTVVTSRRRLRRRGERALREAARAPSLLRLGSMLADTLQEQGAVSRGADHVSVTREDEGIYRCWLRGVPAEESERFATALDDLLAPLPDSGWVIDATVIRDPEAGAEARELAAYGRATPSTRVWYRVPAGVRRRVLRRHWERWVGAGTLLRLSSADGVMVRQDTAARPAVTAVLRRQWS